MRKSSAGVPSYDSMLVPTVRALQALGGSGTTDEIYAKVAQIMELPDSVLDVPHGDSSQSEVEYRLAWSRTYLKKFGLLDNSGRGIWSLMRTDINSDRLDPKEIVKSFRDQARVKRTNRSTITRTTSVSDDTDSGINGWEEELHSVLLTIAPAAFERLIQRLLRESGFIQVEVTGKSGDGGIDGIGIARISGFLSFHVLLFQCKRYQGAINPSQIRVGQCRGEPIRDCLLRLARSRETR